MQNQKKSRKSLLVGIIAAAAILVVLLVALLTQCTGQDSSTAKPAGTTAPAGAETYELYWNLDRDLYDGKSEAGMSSRQPEEDGLFHIRFLLDGEEVTLRTADRKLVNSIETMDLMGLVFDEDGLIIGVVDPEDMPLELAAYMFYVQSVGGNVIKLNSSENFTGMEVMLETNDNTGIWDMSGLSGPVGVEAEPIKYDRVIAVLNLDGELTHVFIVERSNYFLTHEAECQHCEQTVTWYEWTRENELPKRAGHYQLMNDIQLTAQHNLNENVKICLDLNGYTVDGAEDQRVISLDKTSTELALMDTSEEKTGKLAGHGAIGQGGVVWVRNGNFYMYGGTLDGSDVIGTNGVVSMVGANRFFYLYGGTIIGGIARAQAMETTASGFGYGAGGALYIRGTMRMYGGTIRDGRAEAGYNYKKGKLTANRGIGGNIFLNSGSVFEIQGGEIRGGWAGNAGGNIYADGTAELIISGGTIAGGSSNSKANSGHGGNIYTAGKTLVTMSGGTICGGWTSTSNAGGNVAIHGAMNMQGGSIYGGRATNGGNVHVSGNGKFNMYGGAVYGGYAEKYGGNMNASGTSVLTVYGGLIQNGVANSSGGNLNCNVNGTINIAGGSLSGGIAKGKEAGNGGGSISLITNGAKVNISGGIITGGSAEGEVKEDGSTAGGDGGNINMNRGTMTISGGTITGGKATGNAGGIYVGSNSKGLTLSGNAKIYGNGTDIMRSAATAEGKSDIVVDGWQGNGDKGPLVIDRLKGVAKSVIAIPMQDRTLTEADLALFASGRKFLPLTINADGQLAFADRVELGAADHTHCLCGGAYKGHTCADTGFVSIDAETFKACFVMKDNAYHILGSMNLCLTEDVVLDAPYFTVGYTLNLCLNGHTITAKDEGRLTANGTTGVLNIADCTGKGTVKADGSRKGSLMTVYKGELNIYGGTVDASTIKLGTTDATKVGAAVYVRETNDKLAMYGGKIIGGEVYRGGAVFVEKGSFEMYAGEITGGSANIGGNVATSFGSFRMYGGKIYSGSAIANGAGVHIGNGDPSTLILSGDAMIYGNGTEDVYLGQQTSKKLNHLILDGWNGNGGKALVLNARGAGAGSVVAQAKEGDLTEDVLSHLSYVDSELNMKLKDGKVVLGVQSDHEHCLCNGKLDHTCDALGFTEVADADAFKALFKKDGSNNLLIASTNIVLTGSFELSEPYFAKGMVLNLCLNGQTITMSDKARLTPSSGGVLNITDCTGNGTIKAAAGIKQSFLATYTSSINLYGGTMDASAVNSTTLSGGAVILKNTDDSFTMYGGSIIGATKADRGGAIYGEGNGKVAIHGGTITGGTANLGGAISINKGVMEMTGGTITGCTAAQTGGGVNIQANATSFILSGDAKIYGNTANGQPEDVYMGKKNLPLTLDGWNGNGQNGQLVLNCRDAVVASVVAQAKTGDLTADDLAKLNYADSTYVLELKEGKAVLAGAPAAPVTHTHCLCGGKLANTEGHTCQQVTFTEVSDADIFVDMLMAENGDTVNICLTDSIELDDGALKFTGKTVNLCLNDKTLSLNGANLVAEKDAVLNITACNGGEIKAIKKDNAQMLIVKPGCEINLYDGTVDASVVDTTKDGAAIKVASVANATGTSLLNIYGGSIVGGETTGKGGAIYVEKGRVNMYGGEITGGTAKNGGAVSVNYGVMEMTGGTITGCTATGTDATGGGVNVQHNATRFVLSGDAKIYGNTCNGKAEDVYIGNKTNNYYLTLDQWEGNGTNAKLVLTFREPAVGSVVAQAKTGELTAADVAKLKYADSAYVLALNADGKAVLAEIPATPVEHKHCLCNGTLTHTCGELVFTEIATADDFKALFDEDNKLKADSHIVLTGSFELEEQYFSNGHVWSLCLNGQTLTLKGQGRLTANSSGELNITDCDGDGKLLAAEGCRESLITTNNGALNLYSGVINATAIDSTECGGAVNLQKDGDVFTMYGGTIHGGKVDRGGAVYSTSTAQFHMHGGSITGGRATLGGAVSMNKGTMEMTGGTITGCSATSTGGGVNIQANATSFTLSGEAKIYGNTANGQPEDVYMGKKGLCLILNSWTGNGENGALVLSCREATVGSAVAQAKEGALAAEDLAKLNYADSTYVLELKEGKAVLAGAPAAPVTHTHCLCGGKLANTEGHTCQQVTFTEVSDADIFVDMLMAENGDTVNICLTDSIELDDGALKFTGKTVNLCLNDKTLSLNGANLVAEKDAVLNITACNGGGIKAIKKDNAQMLIVKPGCEINLYDGTVDASVVNTTKDGAAIKVASVANATGTSLLNIYGGSIVGGETTGKGGAIYVDRGRINMYSGEITGGTAKNGGAVSVNYGVMEMTGGTITGCTAAGTDATGGAVNVQHNATRFVLSGDAKIYGNTCNGKAEDVYIGNKTNNYYLTLDQWEGNGTNAKLVLTFREPAIDRVVAQAKDGALTAEDLAKLAYADSAYVLALNAEGKIALKTK